MPPPGPPPPPPPPPRERDTSPTRGGARHVSRGMDGERDTDRAEAAARHELHVDRRIAEVARTQQNVISIAQLRALGATQGEWEWRVRHGRLHPQHRGVFVVGSPLLPPLGRERAALLAVPGAVLARGSAGAVWGVLPPHASGPVELLATGNRRSRPGIVVHRTTHLPGADVRTYRGLSLTSPARIVLDLTCHLSTAALERLVAEVLAREPDAKDELARRGTRRVRALIGEGPHRTRSQNERRLLEIVRNAGLPLPQTNVFVAGEEVDAYWPEHRLAVEVDAFFTHGDRVAFERDRRKRAALTVRGVTVLALTDRRLAAEPLAVAATVAQALASARSA